MGSATVRRRDLPARSGSRQVAAALRTGGRAAGDEMTQHGPCVSRYSEGAGGGAPPPRLGRTEISLHIPSSRHIVAAAAVLALDLSFTFQANATMPTRFGEMPPAVVEALESGRFAVGPRRASPGTLSEPAVWNVPIVLAGFSDDTLPYSPPNFDFAMFDTTGRTPTPSVYQD